MSSDTTLATEPPAEGKGVSFTYDAFLSYSHDDGAVAAGIQKGLHRIGRRMGQLNALRVFRDTTDLAANANLWGRVAAVELGLRPTNHTDLNVTPIDQLFLMWTAVNRVSRSGEVIGDDQRVTPLEALKAVTINAAYQYFEEDSKGSIEVGKLADLVILDANPLTIDPMAITDIRVVEILKEGQTIYAG